MKLPVAKINRNRVWNETLFYLILFVALSAGCRFFRNLPLSILCGLAACGVLICAVAAAVRNRESRRETILELDRREQTGNLLEAAVFTPENHPLKEPLRNAAVQRFAKCAIPWRERLFYPLLFLFLAFSGMDVLLSTGKNTVPKTVPPVKTAAPKPVPPENRFAELTLTAPEQETRAKPLDEIEWAGSGNSSHGFSEIKLTVYVNSVRKKEFSPDALPNGKGEIKLAGFLPLEELDVKPFDLVSFHLTGKSGGKTAISLPRFLEVRPFREDAFLMKGMDLPGNRTDRAEDLRGEILLLLQTQLELNKLLFTAKILALSGREPERRTELLKNLEEEQKRLADDLEEFLADENTRKIPADIVNHLELSLKFMRNAVSELNGDKK